MRKRRIAVIVLCCGFLLTLACLLVINRDQGPSCNGRTLRSWVLRLGAAQSDGQDKQIPVEAIRKIGTNALPQLLRWIKYERAPWRTTAAQSIERVLPYRLSRACIDIIQQAKREQLADGASEALVALGRVAHQAIPELSSLMNNPATPESAPRAAEALSGLGTNALPSLIPVLKDPTHPCRFWALASLESMPGLRDAAPLVTPALLTCLEETNGIGVFILAAATLAEFDHEPSRWIPTLLTALASPSSQLRGDTAMILEALGPSSSNAVPALVAALTNTDAEVRFYAEYLLHEIAPRQFTNAPARPYSY